MAGVTSGARGEGESMAKMLEQGADTTYADIGKEPLVGEQPGEEGEMKPEGGAKRI